MIIMKFMRRGRLKMNLIKRKKNEIEEINNNYNNNNNLKK